VRVVTARYEYLAAAINCKLFIYLLVSCCVALHVVTAFLPLPNIRDFSYKQKIAGFQAFVAVLLGSDVTSPVDWHQSNSDVMSFPGIAET
jgi:hypothetical protein